MREFRCSLCEKYWYIDETEEQEVEYCPYCAEKISRSAGETDDFLDNALQRTIRLLGREILLDKNKLIAYLFDIAPELKKEIHIFAKFYNESLLKLFYDFDKYNKAYYRQNIIELIQQTIQRQFPEVLEKALINAMVFALESTTKRDSLKNGSSNTNREVHIFYVLDTSKNMEGAPIATISQLVVNTATILKQQAKKADSRAKVTVLEFNTECRCLQPEGYEELDNFILPDLKTGGERNVSAALEELNFRLTQCLEYDFNGEFIRYPDWWRELILCDLKLKSKISACIPIVIFMIGGNALDNAREALEQLCLNRWYQCCRKIRFAIGEEMDVNMLGEQGIEPDEVCNFERIISLEKDFWRYFEIQSEMLPVWLSQISEKVNEVSLLKLEQQVESSENMDSDMSNLVDDDASDFDDDFIDDFDDDFIDDFDDDFLDEY